MIIPNSEEIKAKTEYFYKDHKIHILVVENMFFRLFGLQMIIPKGFVSDGASLGLLRGVISSFDPLWLFAAIVHDYMCRTQFVPKHIADAIFGEILKETANYFIAITFKAGVKFLGHLAWYRNKQKLEKYPQAKHDLMMFICSQIPKPE